MNRTTVSTLAELAASDSSRSARLLLDQSLYPIDCLRDAVQEINPTCSVTLEPDTPDAYWVHVQLMPEQLGAASTLLGELLNRVLILVATHRIPRTDEAR